MGIVYMKDILDAISESTGAVENAEIYFPDSLYGIDGVESEDWYETEI